MVFGMKTFVLQGFGGRIWFPMVGSPQPSYWFLPHWVAVLRTIDGHLSGCLVGILLGKKEALVMIFRLFLGQKKEGIDQMGLDRWSERELVDQMG